ncbi:uncharacterized protein LOC103957589 isoform X2 [Pyrus x bretschneideri]|uniref:uncharacterized protein LOC103957589 isoform X2 n=1 Tax=Pyrus x bretschneideri TaxID=225117 RepID=UPI00202F5D47|nr:uncharacterized protein LOC103957589 isoform X2 [Pyrus x bretschneideri]
MSRRVAGPGSESGSPKFARLEVTRSNFKSVAGPKKLRDMKKTAVKDSPTQLKNENVVQEGMAQLQLNEENTTTPKPEERKMHRAVVFTRPIKFTIPCKVCGVVGHLNDDCPYMIRVPNNVTEVGKGYEIVTFRGKRHAESMVCGYCHIGADHQNDDCPHKSKIIARRNSLRKASPAGPLTS